MRPALTPSERRAIVDKHAKRKGLLLPWCCFGGHVKGAPIPHAAVESVGLSDGVCARCMPAFKAAYGYTSKKSAA